MWGQPAFPVLIGLDASIQAGPAENVGAAAFLERVSQGLWPMVQPDGGPFYS